MKSFKEGELVLWMPKAIKIKGGKFTLPFKIQKVFDNNTMELSTISDEGVERVNINKLKAYQHDNWPIDAIITIVIVDTRPSGKNKNRKKNKLNFPPNLHTKQKNLPLTDPKPRKIFSENDIKWIKEESSRNGIPKMSKNERLKKFNYRRREKTTMSLYPKIIVNEEGGHKNKKNWSRA